MKKTAVEWLVEQIDPNLLVTEKVILAVQQAKAMEKEQSHKYAEFAIRCDRKDMRILNFEDWIKL